MDKLAFSCFHCGSSRFTLCRWLSFRTFSLIRCQGCDLLHLYPVRYHANGHEQLGEAETRRQLYLLSQHDSAPFNHGNGILDLVENYTRGGRLLDIGCKTGELLKAAQLRGWASFGVDVSPAFCDIVRSQGFDVHCGVIENMDQRISGFDVIVMSHVLEHIQNPRLALQSVYERLKPNGYLYVETPDVSSPIAWGVYCERWLGIATPGHVWAFTSKTLQSVIQGSGLTVVWSNRWIPYARHDYPRTFKGQARFLLFTMLNAFGWGDIVGVLAQKKASDHREDLNA